MRKLKIQKTSFLAVLLMVSCTNFLNVQPQGSVIPETDEEFASIMHNHLLDIEGGGDNYIIGNMEVIAVLEGIADNLDANIKIGSLKAYSGDIINAKMTDYRETFEIIRDCNIVIENLEGRQTRKAKDVLSCAYAMKGICYYNLIRDFCDPWDDGNADSQLGLPIIDRFDVSDRTVRSSLAQTVEYTEHLLGRSIELEMSDPLFFFTEYITKSYLARLLFWSERWDDCAELCEDILANSGYSLSDLNSYESVIQSVNDKKGEVIVRSHINNASELDWYFSYLKGYIKSRPASAAFVKLFGEHPEDDIRYSISIDSKRFNNKTPEMKLRVSEIVLMLAECRYHAGQFQAALDIVNELRAARIKGALPLALNELPRVRESDRIVEDATGAQITPLMQLIMDERRKELFMEGDRWYELKRNGRPEWWIINNGLKYTTRKYLYTAPVYKGDVDLNPEMKQNEGYE